MDRTAGIADFGVVIEMPGDSLGIIIGAREGEASIRSGQRGGDFICGVQTLRDDINGFLHVGEKGGIFTHTAKFRQKDQCPLALFYFRLLIKPFLQIPEPFRQIYEVFWDVPDDFVGP